MRNCLLVALGFCAFVQFVVSQVNLPPETQLTPGEQATIRSQLIGRCFDQPHVRELASRVRDTLQSFGYFRATVSEPNMTIVDAARYPEPVSLNIEVAEGARYKVREITWSGMKAVTGDQLYPISPIRPDDIFDTSKVRETLEAVRRLYATIGYPTATIVPQVQVHEAGHWVSLYFSVVEGVQSP